MKKIAFAALVIFLCGCSMGREELRTLVTDPHYAQYQEKLDSLEESFLKKEITYAQYVEKKKEIDDSYAKEVQARENIIHAQ